LDEFAQAEAQGPPKMQQQIGGQATMLLALVREIELGTLETELGT
jgi:hypothetical protein